MKALFITNDLHDALNSRVKFKNWFEKQNNYSLDIAAPVTSKNKFPEISLPLNNRGLTFSNIISVNNYINDIHRNTIVFRGIENIESIHFCYDLAKLDKEILNIISLESFNLNKIDSQRNYILFNDKHKYDKTILNAIDEILEVNPG